MSDIYSIMKKIAEDLEDVRNGSCDHANDILAEHRKEMRELLKGSWAKQEDYMNKIYEGLGMPCGPSMCGWKKDDPEPEPAPSDSVNHPSHYTFGDIEVIDYIRDKLTPEEFQGYCNGNVLKYISRWRRKGGVEDLKKADVYLCWMIESALGEAKQK